MGTQPVVWGTVCVLPPPIKLSPSPGISAGIREKLSLRLNKVRQNIGTKESQACIRTTLACIKLHPPAWAFCFILIYAVYLKHINTREIVKSANVQRGVVSILNNLPPRQSLWVFFWHSTSESLSQTDFDPRGLPNARSFFYFRTHLLLRPIQKFNAPDPS